MSDFIKAEKVVRTSLGLLEREIVLPRLVWRDAAGDFRGTKGDTITMRLPSYAKAKKRALRSGAARTKSQLHERKVDVSLDTNIYMDVPITDEELTLDIEDFGAQILNPVLGGVARSLEDEVADLITGATYAKSIELDLSGIKPVVAEARELLNKANVPVTDRTLLIGAEVDTEIIQLDNFVRFDQSGTTDTLREAKIGRVYGFDVVTTNLIAPGEAFAFHKTAYVLNSRAPIVPAGAPWGATDSFAGFAIRTVRVFDPDEVEDRFVADAWCGVNVVTDQGEFDVNGMWEPAEDPTGIAPQLVRAVHLTAPVVGG